MQINQPQMAAFMPGHDDGGVAGVWWAGLFWVGVVAMARDHGIHARDGCNRARGMFGLWGGCDRAKARMTEHHHQISTRAAQCSHLRRNCVGNIAAVQPAGQNLSIPLCSLWRGRARDTDAQCCNLAQAGAQLPLQDH